MKTQVIESAIRSIKGCTFISMRYASEPSLNKSEKLALSLMGGFNEIVPIVKVTDGQFQANYSYENAVNNRGEKEQGHSIDFVSAPLRWGQWVAGQVNKLIEHKGELYFRFYGLKNGKVENEYFVGGIPATSEQIEFIKKCTEKGEVKNQASAGLTENQVIARNVKLSNIIELTINGATIQNNELKLAV
jgi:hypothetical protein